MFTPWIVSLQFLVGTIWVYAVSCAPTEHARTDGTNWRLASLEARDVRKAPNAPSVAGKELRIMPLGDSITQGFRSSNSNGYRLDLQNLLLTGNNSVDMVGLYTSGNMTDNQEQGIDGATISVISSALPPALALRPNIVLLHAGTNDMNLNLNVSSAPARLNSLIDRILTGCPDASVLVAKIIHSPNATTNARIWPYDNAVGEMVANRTRAGEHVLLVDMQNALPANQYNDTLHPNDEGYKTMAGLWYRGIEMVTEAGWIGRPVNVDDGTN